MADDDDDGQCQVSRSSAAHDHWPGDNIFISALISRGQVTCGRAAGPLTFTCTCPAAANKAKVYRQVDCCCCCLVFVFFSIYIHLSMFIVCVFLSVLWYFVIASPACFPFLYLVFVVFSFCDCSFIHLFTSCPVIIYLFYLFIHFQRLVVLFLFIGCHIF